MFSHNSFYKATFVFAMTLPMSLAAPSAFAQQVTTLEAAVPEASETVTEETATVLDTASEEANSLTVVEETLSIPDFFPTHKLEEQRFEGLSEAAELTAEEVVVPVKRPGASALGRLESVGLTDGLSFKAAELDFSAISKDFGVESNSVPALTAALNSENVLTRLYAADALWTMTGDRNLILPTLIQAAASEEDQARELAIAALTQMGEQALPAVPVLNELLLDPNSRTRLVAQDAITVIRSDDRSSAITGIVFREARRRLLPAAVRAITDLWR